MDQFRGKELNESNKHIPIEENFKLYAGPGAGKTHFLVEHVKRILAESERLGKLRRIACITHTNIGANTIKERLGEAAVHTVVSTIHSFLYEHVVHPYLWKLEDCPFPVDELNGHAEIILRYTQLEKFKEISKQYHLRDDSILREDLKNIQWVMDKGSLKLSMIAYAKREDGEYSVSKESFQTYKDICWSSGLMSHDDVLYFSYLLLEQEERIREIIRAKFPYILVDEFQDTSPLQAEIIKLIVKKESVIGVVGDPCQAIFSFQGADAEFFDNFEVSGMRHYYTKVNRRSSNEIICVLNHLRSSESFEQTLCSDRNEVKPKVIVGSSWQAQKYIKTLIGGDGITVLAYRNDTILSMESGSEGFVDIDTNIISRDYHRGWMIHFVILSIQYGKQLKVKEAIQSMQKAYRRVEGFSRRDAFANLKRLLEKYEEYVGSNIMEFYNDFIYGTYGVMGKITGGKIKSFYSALTYKQLASLVEETGKESIFRTIHKSKGDEFNNVLIVLTEEDSEVSLDFLKSPNMKNESHRVYYVGMSRAIKRLYLSVPFLPRGDESILADIGIDVERL